MQIHKADSGQNQIQPCLESDWEHSWRRVLDTFASNFGFSNNNVLLQHSNCKILQGVPAMPVYDPPIPVGLLKCMQPKRVAQKSVIWYFTYHNGQFKAFCFTHTDKK